MSDIVQELRDDDLPFGVREGMAHAAADAIEARDAEIERLRIRCDGYQASRDWAIKTLANALHVETDTVRAVEYYARLASEELERLRAELAAEKQANTELQLALGAKDYDLTEVRGELAAKKALLRESLGAIYTYSLDGVSLHARIRAALGDAP